MYWMMLLASTAFAWDQAETVDPMGRYTTRVVQVHASDPIRTSHGEATPALQLVCFGKGKISAAMKLDAVVTTSGIGEGWGYHQTRWPDGTLGKTVWFEAEGHTKLTQRPSDTAKLIRGLERGGNGPLLIEVGVYGVGKQVVSFDVTDSSRVLSWLREGGCR